MKDFYEFASEHPFLTLFLVWCVSDTVVGVAKAIFSK